MGCKRKSPVVAVTMGDIAGIGPEIIAKSLLKSTPSHPAVFVIVGDEGILDAACRSLKISRRPTPWNGSRDLGELPPGVYLHSITQIRPGAVQMGAADKRWGRASVDYIRCAAELALSKQADAVVTAPISKEATHKAGHSFEGHTEYLAHLAQVPDVRMMFLGPRLRVILQTIHMALRAVSGVLTPQSIFDTIRMGGQALKLIGVENPRIWICGLNPHAGEAGAFGREDDDIIRPAVTAALRMGWQASGPYPSDTLFYRALRGKPDLIVAMYHDQGLIPFKMLHFDKGVNATVGLPFVRTSPDHGTAYDIAGKGIADPTSMREAIHWAILMSKARFAPRKSLKKG